MTCLCNYEQALKGADTNAPLCAELGQSLLDAYVGCSRKPGRVIESTSRDGALQSATARLLSLPRAWNATVANAANRVLPAHRSDEKLDERYPIGAAGIRQSRRSRKVTARKTSEKTRRMDERYLPVLAYWWGRCSFTTSS
jgi:hypothetical protein